MTDIVERLRHWGGALNTEAADEIERLRATPWQPIATAPRDGTLKILARFNEQGKLRWVKYGSWRKSYLDGYREAWRETDVAPDAHAGYFELTPTHWMFIEPPQPSES